MKKIKPILVLILLTILASCSSTSSNNGIKIGSSTLKHGENLEDIQKKLGQFSEMEEQYEHRSLSFATNNVEILINPKTSRLVTLFFQYGKMADDVYINGLKANSSLEEFLKLNKYYVQILDSMYLIPIKDNKVLDSKVKTLEELKDIDFDFVYFYDFQDNKLINGGFSDSIFLKK